MRKLLFKIWYLLWVLIVAISLVPLGNVVGQPTQEYTSSFLLLNHVEGNTLYEFNITISQELYLYYTKQNHVAKSINDLSMYVTPKAFQPVADVLWQLYNNTEEFTNGVLMLVHQITYVRTDPGRYPVETLVIGQGDCDLFCYIAASILEAGGISTVLLGYREQDHMQIGVDLGVPPVNVRNEVFSVTYMGVPYYIAECTDNVWRTSWRVGECPESFQGVTAQVIPLTDIEKSAIGQVGVSLRELEASTLTLRVSSSIIVKNKEVMISGQILPIVENENVTIRAQVNGSNWFTITAVTTQQDGKFNYSWIPPVTGVIDIQAKWAGNKEYNGAYSNTRGIIVLPLEVIIIILTTAIALTIITVLFIKLLRRKPSTTLPLTTGESEPQNIEKPSTENPSTENPSPSLDENFEDTSEFNELEFENTQENGL